MRSAGIRSLSGEILPLYLPAPGAPEPDMVLIDVRSAGVGNWDDLMRTGGWPSELEYPHALGVQAAGVIRATGLGVTEIVAGDEVLTHVFPFHGGGCWAEQVMVPAAFVAPKPAALSWAEAAALPVPALTAYQVLHDVLAISAGQRLLVHGAGGVTGGWVVQLALAVGADVVATAGPAVASRLRSYGPVQVLDRTTDWVPTARRLLGKGAERAVNAAPAGSQVALSLVADGGALVSITDQPPAPQRGIQVSYHVVRPDAGQLTALGVLAEHREIASPATHEYALQDAAVAMQAVRDGSRGGAVTLRIKLDHRKIYPI